ncbi:hypothetical protein OIV83_005409 [Microbotryomycetes sp. JL201]|nr:hypothetical protein OIV83_005409 [Microbotryomycetes sp. JL201]
MSLPPVPTGENPFTVYLAALHKAAYYDPPPAFRGRMVALATCCVCGMVVSIVYGLILVPQYSSKSLPFAGRWRRRRREQQQQSSLAEPQAPLSAFRAPQHPPQKPKFWIARRVDGYLTMNLHFLVPFGGFISCAGMLVYTYTSYVVMRHGRMLGPYNTFRSFLWVPIVVHGYLVTAASFQAWIVVASKTARMTRGSSHFGSPVGQPRSFWQRHTRLPGVYALPGPRLFNSLFYGCTAVLTLSMVASDIAFAISWGRVWRAMSTLQSNLEFWQQQWPDRQDFSTLIKLQRLYSDITSAVADNVAYKDAVILILIVVAFIVALLNIGSISLLLLLRKQIRAAVRRRSRTQNLFPLPPPPLTFQKEKPASPVIDQIPPTINVTFPSRPRPAAAKRLSFGLLDEKYSASSSERSSSNPSSTDTPPTTTTAMPPSVTPGLGNRRFSLSANLPSLPRLPRKGSSFTVKTAWTSTTKGSHGLSPNAKTPSTAFMYSPASPSMAIDLGGKSSLSDLKRAERDLEIASSADMNAGESIC